MADRQRQPIIEFVGVPGAGKSTLTRVFRQGFADTLGPELGAASRLGSARLYAAAAAFFLSLRPLSANDAHRCFKIIEAYNVYRHGLAAPLVLDQGLIQRLWSAVTDRERFSQDRLEALTRILAEAPPDVIVRVNTPPATAAERILSRTGGNSRYERMAREDLVQRLAPANATYDMLVEQFRRHSSVAILEIPGEAPVDENVRRIAEFVRDVLPRLGARPR
jgi:hypothetical protein